MYFRRYLEYEIYYKLNRIKILNIKIKYKYYLNNYNINIKINL
jgi:hypothetical protein